MKVEKSYLCPLFWQHHESEAALREELQKMKENGIGGFIVESRPHPDYLGKTWWEDLDIILDEAKKLDMEMWLFDDGSYPSGTAYGLLAKKYPEYTKRYLAFHSVDVIGPARESAVFINDWLEPGEKFLCAVAGKRLDHDALFDLDTFVDVSGYVKEGMLYWDIPPGEWRIFIFKITRNGGEEWTKDYLNPMDPEGTRAYLDIVYEAHYSHLGHEFGKTIKGFFTDEPRFGNSPGYDRQIGYPMVLPWSDTLTAELSGYGLGDFKRLLPALWFDCGEKTPDVRYIYMDAASKRFDKNFLGQMGNWCREHGVRLIGHVVEENGCHARLGFGTGHYFRAMDGLDMAGIDVVNNIYPGRRDGKYWTGFNNYDTTFNHWGLSKMASSCAHLDPKKKGDSICEAFGAYGWTEGLKTMKWITDAMCVRGINHIIPHAFSPHDYPDPDCPPHFYARGNNPQFKQFSVWSDYANRICDRISGGIHVAPAAVLYHAEAEWGGQSDPFELAVKVLMQNQIDCDVVPADILSDPQKCQVEGGRLYINGETYGVLIVPYAEYLPKGIVERMKAMTGEGLTIIFLKDYPRRCYLGEEFVPCQGMLTAGYETLIPLMVSLRKQDITVTSGGSEYLSYYHYQKDGVDSYFFTNESLLEDIEAKVNFKDGRNALFYDPMTGEYLKAKQEKQECCGQTHTEVSLYLRPYESIFVVFGEGYGMEVENRRMEKDDGKNMLVLPRDGWKIEISEPLAYPQFEETGKTRLVNLARPDELPEFSGTVRYTITFEGQKAAHAVLTLGEVYESVKVWLNGKVAGEAICPPYRIYLGEGMIQEGENELVIEVTNTLVKANHKNPYDRYWLQEPTGLLGPVKIIYE